jgi:flagellar biosynthetic protein FlhB
MAGGSDEDESAKTEDPTPRKLEEARKRGQVVNSREVTNFLMILSLAFIIFWVFPYSSKNTLFLLKGFVENVHNIDISGSNFIQLLSHTINKVLLYSILPLAFLVIIAMISSFVQQEGQINLSFDPITPDLSKLSPLAGLKRMFSMKSLVEFIKGIIKISIVAVILYFAIMANTKHLLSYIHFSPMMIVEKIYSIINNLLLYVCMFLFVIAVIDYTYQRFEHMKSLRMTKQEIKEEYKDTEGSPEIKQKLRQLRAEKAKNRMVADVPKADVVVTNPTHYSIALKYDSDKMSAPKVVAKGQDNIALKIREIAKEHDIPLVENKPLARALFDNVDVGEEVPVEHYEAVAAVISYVYKLKGKKFK